jgi:hypothetical protein
MKHYLVKERTVADDAATHMLTTVDNPYDPFTQWDEWWEFDTSKGYNTASFLARIAKVSDDLSESDQTEAIESAIDEIVKENVRGIYKKAVSKQKI